LGQKFERESILGSQIGLQNFNRYLRQLPLNDFQSTAFYIFVNKFLVSINPVVETLFIFFVSYNQTLISNLVWRVTLLDIDSSLILSGI